MMLKLTILILTIRLLATFSFANEVYIDREIKPKVIELITNAKQSIDIEVFILSDWDIISALKKASSRDVKVRIILDPYCRENHYTFDKFLDSHVEIKFYYIKRPAIFHRKFILINNKTLLIGSCNLSYNGLKNSKEIMVEIEDKKVISSILNIISSGFY